MSSDRHWEHLKTKWDTLRKQALKHTGQLVTVCYRCCKAASTGLQHMPVILKCQLFLRESVSDCVYRGSSRERHVEVKAIWCAVTPLTPVCCTTSMLSGTLLHFKEAPLDCLSAGACPGQPQSRGRCLLTWAHEWRKKKKKKKRHHRAELSSRCLVSHDWKEMLRLAECRGKHSAVILFHYLLPRTVTQLYLQDACWHLRVNLVFSEVSYCLIRSWHGVLYFHTSLNIGLNMAALTSAVAPWAAAESKGNCGISRK